MHSSHSQTDDEDLYYTNRLFSASHGILLSSSWLDINKGQNACPLLLLVYSSPQKTPQTHKTHVDGYTVAHGQKGRVQEEKKRKTT